MANILICGGISLDENKHIVTVNGSPVSLTLKEYELLKLFMDNPGRVFTREFLLSNIWGMDFAGESRTVTLGLN